MLCSVYCASGHLWFQLSSFAFSTAKTHKDRTQHVCSLRARPESGTPPKSFSYCSGAEKEERSRDRIRENGTMAELNHAASVGFGKVDLTCNKLERFLPAGETA